MDKFKRTDSSIKNLDTELLRWTAPELLKHGERNIMQGLGSSSGHSRPQAVDVYSLG